MGVQADRMYLFWYSSKINSCISVEIRWVQLEAAGNIFQSCKKKKFKTKIGQLSVTGLLKGTATLMISMFYQKELYEP